MDKIEGGRSLANIKRIEKDLRDVDARRISLEEELEAAIEWHNERLTQKTNN